MKKIYALLVATALLAPATALAQQPWQPFRPGLTYQFSESGTPGDTTHTLQVGAGTRILGTTDSVFRFNGRAVVARIPSSGSCSGNKQLRADNLFGATLRSQSNGVFIFGASNGRTFMLRPQASIGQSWSVGVASLTARVTSRSTAAVLNSALSDSIVAISLSDGNSLRLSKMHGLLNGPSIDHYLNGRNTSRTMTLTAIPTRHMGTAVTGPFGAFNYAAGDIFQRYYRSTMYFSGSPCVERWTKDSVISREMNRRKDSITYTIRTWRREIGYGFPNAPSAFCTVPTGTVINPPYTYTLIVRNELYAGAPQLLTNYFLRIFPTLPSVIISTAAARSRYNNRREWKEECYARCISSITDSASFTYDFGSDYRTYETYAEGLGSTRRGSYGIYSHDTTSLIAYRKGAETWGSFFPNSFFLTARDVRPAPTTTAFPNPFATTLTTTFALARPQAVAAELRDALGRTVRQVPAAAFAAGAGRLELPTAGLPAGVYTLHLRFASEGRSEVLKVVKAE